MREPANFPIWVPGWYLLAVIQVSLRTLEKNQGRGGDYKYRFQPVELESSLWLVFPSGGIDEHEVLYESNWQGCFILFNHTSTTLSFFFFYVAFFSFDLADFESWVKPLCLCFPSGHEGSVTAAKLLAWMLVEVISFKPLRYTGN